MEFNNKKLTRTTKFINYTIAIILCGFLIGLSGKILDDIDEWKERPAVSEFENKEFIAEKQSEYDIFQQQLNEKNGKKNNILSTIQVAKNNYENEKQSFDNWLEARKTVGSPREDSEVISRANKLDEYYKVEQEWRNELTGIEDEINKIQSQQIEISDAINDERQKAYEASEKAYQKYELKIFLIRLLIILPILLIGIYFFTKFRKHKYWPLFLGFILFAVYAFFFGLIPYLPSYGGYVRYTVGIILSIFIGIYSINKIKAFIEKKKAELKISKDERAKKVQTGTAEKALDNHMCPSCGKNFILKNWDLSATKDDNLRNLNLVTSFCRYCGLELFKKCETCGCNNFAHLPFCANCGDPVMKSDENDQP